MFIVADLVSLSLHYAGFFFANFRLYLVIRKESTIILNAMVYG